MTEAQTAVAGGGRARHPTSSGSELCLMGRAEQSICLAWLVYLRRAVLALIIKALLQGEEALTVRTPLPPPAPPTPCTRPGRACGAWDLPAGKRASHLCPRWQVYLRRVGQVLQGRFTLNVFSHKMAGQCRPAPRDALGAHASRFAAVGDRSSGTRSWGPGLDAPLFRTRLGPREGPQSRRRVQRGRGTPGRAPRVEQGPPTRVRGRSERTWNLRPLLGNRIENCFTNVGSDRLGGRRKHRHPPASG